MHLDSIHIKNFRNIKEVKTKLSEQGNLIIEKNGQGKTNFLEAIFYSVFGNSFKPIESSSEVVSNGSEFARVETKWGKSGGFLQLKAVVSTGNTQQNLLRSNKLTRTFSVNDKRIPIKKISSKIHILLFAPHSVDLVSGEPKTRREDLDNYLSTLFPEYSGFLQQYNTVLKNRNALLKNIREGKSSKNELTFWTNKLTTLASEIYYLRLKFFNEINEFITIAASELYSNFNDFKVKYLPNISPDEENELSFLDTLKQKYEDNMEKEIIVGKTLYGIHKDDYELLLNDRNLRFMGSRGQQRIGSFLLKIAQYRFFFHSTNSEMLFLIDDLMSELDDEHRENVAQFLLNEGFQFILTGAVVEEFPKILLDTCKRISLE